MPLQIFEEAIFLHHTSVQSLTKRNSSRLEAKNPIIFDKLSKKEQQSTIENNCMKIRTDKMYRAFWILTTALSILWNFKISRVLNKSFLLSNKWHLVTNGQGRGCQ